MPYHREAHLTIIHILEVFLRSRNRTLLFITELFAKGEANIYIVRLLYYRIVSECV